MTIDCSFNSQEIYHIAGPCIRPGGPALTERAFEICSLPPGSRVADIGCGAGGTLGYLERTGVIQAVGLDYSEALLGEAVPLLVTGRRLARGRAENLPFKKDSFDALFCECVLSTLGDRTAALQECVRVLKEGGFLIVSDVFGQGGLEQRQPETKSQRLPTKGLLEKKNLLVFLRRLGFSILLWEEHQRLLKEFVARMILAGERLPDPWGCREGQGKRKANRPQISYFLLVARKPGTPFRSVENKGDGTSWTTKSCRW
jgi:ubiquinone/menaquinone biosynthesis C-methylase UbiE